MTAWIWLSLHSMAQAAPAECPALAGKPLAGDAGKRKIALLVGVGDYLATVDGRSIDLQGPPNDVRRLRDVLQTTYGFPADNVCVLLDSDATRANLDAAWSKHLERASSGDTVVYFFSGHGSQTTDFDGPGDETDKLDETVLLHDSRTPKGGSELLDDEFNAMLLRLYALTQNVTVIVDSCNSGTSTRGDVAVPRAVDPLMRSAPAQGARLAAVGDYQPSRFENMVFVSAARDGTVALERNGEGVFTNALLSALEAGPNQSWSQLALAIPRGVAAQKSFQVPSFEGQLDREAFGTAVIGRPLSWPVVGVNGAKVSFRGPSLPGWTPGAVVEIRGADGKTVKGTVELTKVEPMRAEGAVRGTPAKPIGADGDYGVLATPGPESFGVTVRFLPGVPLANEITKQLGATEVLKRTVQVVNGPADFEVRPAGPGLVEIWGAEGGRRNRLDAKTPEDAGNVAWALGLHARQASLLGLTSEVTTTYPQDSVLRMRVLPAAKQNGCAREPYTPDPVAGSYVSVPMCNAVELDVELTIEPQSPLHVAVLYLANDGAIVAYPQGNTTEILRHEGEHFRMPLGWVAPPLGSPDRLLAFGTHEQVNWSQLEAKAPPAATRGGGLQAFLNAHTSATRGTVREDEDPMRANGWTSSFLQLEVTGDEDVWSAGERGSSSTCSARRKAAEASGGTCPK